MRVGELTELSSALAGIRYRGNYTQRDYNREIGTQLLGRGWRPEAHLTEGLGLRCDFEKNGVWLEVEFGNARAYYQDYVKFLVAHRYRTARCGVLLCPTDAFAGLLCELGRQRAAKKRVSGGSTQPTYSGMMSYEKALRELPRLRFMLSAPIVLAGVDVETVN